MRTRPIIIIDDDKDDVEFIKVAFGTMLVEYPLVTFDNTLDALDYLKADDRSPFIILCDVNMPLINGFEARRMMESDKSLKLKSTPFLFLSTAADKTNIDKAYGLSIQGYFKKPSTLKEMMKILGDIVSYWERSYCPNKSS